jgi:small subunit ribosomal protein S5
MEQVGVNNILSKCYGSNNILNVVRATVNALENLQDAVTIANKRGITIKEVFS